MQWCPFILQSATKETRFKRVRIFSLALFARNNFGLELKNDVLLPNFFKVIIFNSKICSEKVQHLSPLGANQGQQFLLEGIFALLGKFLPVLTPNALGVPVSEFFPVAAD